METIGDGSISWETASLIAEKLKLEYWVCENIIILLETGCTIPFIARYRKEQTNDIEVNILKEFKSLCEELLVVRAKILSVYKAIHKTGKMTVELKIALQSAESLQEIDDLYCPYKAGSKRSLAERAKELGLQATVNNILHNPSQVNIQNLVNPTKKGLSTLAEVETGLQHIIADVISKDKETMDYVKKLCKESQINLQSTRTKTANKKKENNSKDKDKPDTAYKYELYFNFTWSLRRLKPHQILAINRGESQKILSVKIVLADDIQARYKTFCQRKWIPDRCSTCLSSLMLRSIDDAYNRLIEPGMIRRFRSDLTKMANKSSVDVFEGNLKHLLLTPPVRGKVVLGVDPGFTHGCKCAISDPTGAVLETFVLFIHGRGNKVGQGQIDMLKTALLKHRCETVAIGNGTACRETEEFFSRQIQSKMFAPLDVRYCIVSETGASIYSVSDIAQQELPGMDQNLRGAVSIARRLQDPLVELVKIEPKHLGVGMYQHDIPENQLKAALDETVTECVSFVGVDVNYCTEFILRRVAGMSAGVAKKVIAWREANGPIINREELKTIKGLGPKTFEQCAGFIKVLQKMERDQSVNSDIVEEESAQKTDTKSKKRKASSQNKKVKKAKVVEQNALDRTCIHPESYMITLRIMQKVNATDDDIGKPSMTNKMKSLTNNLNQLSDELGTGEATLKMIIDALQQPTDFDIRNEYESPLFKRGIRSIHDLRTNDVIMGKVVNVTHFGAFVDIGVGRDGLIHNSKMNTKLELGFNVEVTVVSVDRDRGRIGLGLVAVVK